MNYLITLFEIILKINTKICNLHCKLLHFDFQKIYRVSNVCAFLLFYSFCI